ncbi:MAG: response regulator transcription factor [Burkholderiaceae bacterium]|nr:response regulator transcription factor [Burkholderiaceae bacterium]
MNRPPSLHILIVEDNDGLREATMDFLTEHGHHTTGVASAEEVDDIALRDVPDLYLVDVNLPGENGFALTQRLRQSQPLAGIVLMTARGQLHDRLDGYQHGADNYLIKPVEPAELLACVHSLAFRLKSTRQPLTGGLVLHSGALRLSGPMGEATLTHGESLMLAALCRAAGHKLERWQAMQLVDSKDKGLSPANMEMRISALRKKLDQCGAPDNPILTLRGFGYALACPVEVR